jgi:hypothetical protein
MGKKVAHNRLSQETVIEQFKEVHGGFKYRPSKWFAGHTECYTLELPVQEIKDL